MYQSAAERQGVVRFDKTVRWFHWTFAVSFLCLAATGGALALRGPLGLGEEAGGVVLRVHLGAALTLLLAPALIGLSGRTGVLRSELAELVRWSRDDLRWLARQPLAMIGRAELPPAGKLNAGQKVNGILMALLTAALVGSGAMLWLRPGALLPLVVHVAAFLAWIPLFLGHLCLALVLPGTRPALRGMVTGKVSREWARHHHPRWIEELEAPPGASPRR